ncbi:membrane protein insertase YidC [uncultured Campylobacter sp.]|uniref:membrane protein insertase YidC n=1 Tax=uncultured Campylobacter sp. TaxID=218934 RepID=UPI00260C8243|nr:membrane protein insertase YidC [uncultured Campylobacter sp.]
MLDKLPQSKRLAIAVALALIFFVAYDHFYLSKIRASMEANATAAQSAQNTAAPQTSAAGAGAQSANLNTANSASAPLVRVIGKEANFTIDGLGRISSYLLNDAKFRDGNGEALNLIDAKSHSKPLEVRFEDAALNAMAFDTPYSASSSELDVRNGEASVSLIQNLGSVTITKNLTFFPNGSYKLDVKLSGSAPYFITPGSRPNVEVDNYTIHGVIVGKPGEAGIFDKLTSFFTDSQSTKENVEIFKDGDVDSNERISNANIAASSDRYYTTLFYGNNMDVTVTDADKISQAFIRSNGDFSVTGYLGAKDHATLNSIDPVLTNIIEYGWFTFIARPMFKFLNWLHGYIGNWGWSIVVLTLIIRLILFPLSYKGMLSMNKLKDLAPKMKELQEKYKDDKQKLQMHMMDLYKKNGANPMGGCLPILLQIPVFFAIYRVLLNAIELKGAEWALWIHDLSLKDPYYILPIMMGILMFLQQKITPTTFTDPMQEKMMKFLPLIFTVFLAMFPAGLTLYWTINNFCSIIQQYVINKAFARHKRAQVAEKKS